MRPIWNGRGGRGLGEGWLVLQVRYQYPVELHLCAGGVHLASRLLALIPRRGREVLWKR